MVFASSYYKHDLGALTVATVSAPIIPLACIATCCFAKKDKLIGYALIIMALFFAASGISSISATTLSVSKTIASSFYFQAIGNFLFAIGALLGAISVLTRKRSKNLYLAFAIIALAAAVMGIIENALMQTLPTTNTLKVLMEGVGLFALGMSYMKSIDESQAPVQEPSAAALSSAQLSDYKQLLDQGIITQEEFDEQKKRFLQG